MTAIFLRYAVLRCTALLLLRSCTPAEPAHLARRLQVPTLRQVLAAVQAGKVGAFAGLYTWLLAKVGEPSSLRVIDRGTFVCLRACLSRAFAGLYTSLLAGGAGAPQPCPHFTSPQVLPYAILRHCNQKRPCWTACCRR